MIYMALASTNFLISSSSAFMVSQRDGSASSPFKPGGKLHLFASSKLYCIAEFRRVGSGKADEFTVGYPGIKGCSDSDRCMRIEKIAAAAVKVGDGLQGLFPVY